MSDADDLVLSLRPVADAMQSLGVRFYVGGSVASSFHGAVRSTMDVDLVCELTEASLPRRLGDDCYASEPANGPFCDAGSGLAFRRNPGELAWSAGQIWRGFWAVRIFRRCVDQSHLSQWRSLVFSVELTSREKMDPVFPSG